MGNAMPMLMIRARGQEAVQAISDNGLLGLNKGAALAGKGMVVPGAQPGVFLMSPSPVGAQPGMVLLSPAPAAQPGVMLVPPVQAAPQGMMLVPPAPQQGVMLVSPAPQQGMMLMSPAPAAPQQGMMLMSPAQAAPQQGMMIVAPQPVAQQGALLGPDPATMAANAKAGLAGLGKAGAMGGMALGDGGREITLAAANGARMEIKRNGIIQMKNAAGQEIKVAANANGGLAGLKANAGVGGMQGMQGMQVNDAGRELTMTAANGAKMEVKRNGVIQMKNAAGQEMKMAANAKGGLAGLGGGNAATATLGGGGNTAVGGMPVNDAARELTLAAGRPINVAPDPNCAAAGLGKANAAMGAMPVNDAARELTMGAGQQIKVAVNGLGQMAAPKGAVTTVAATQVIASTTPPAVAQGALGAKAGMAMASAPPAAAASAKTGVAAASKAVGVGTTKAATASAAAAGAGAVTAATPWSLGLGLGLGIWGPVLLVGAIGLTAAGVYGYVKHRRAALGEAHGDGW